MTTTRNRTLIPLLFLAATTLGCSKNDEPVKKTDTEVEVTATKVTQDEAPAPDAAPEAEIPTAVDFEGDAVLEISDESLEKELSAIENELSN